MKFAHLADTHLGYRQFGLIEREKDFYEVFEKVIDKIIEEKVDFVIHSGDLFETAKPSPNALLAFQKGLLKLKGAGITMYAIAGNHDSVMRKGAIPPQVIFKKLGLKVISPINPFYVHGDLFIAGLPFYPASQSKLLKSKLAELSKKAANYEKSVLVLHQGIDKYFGYQYELELGDVPDNFSYYALGHVHKYVNDSFGNGRLVYPGSTEIWKTDELEDYKNDGKGCVIVDFDGPKPVIKRLSIDAGREFIIRTIDYNKLESNVAGIKEIIKDFDKKPILDLTIKNVDGNTKDIYEIINNELGDLALMIRPKFEIIDENRTGDPPFPGSVGPKELIVEQLEKYNDKNVEQFALELYDFLSKDKNGESKELVHQFFNDHYSKNPKYCNVEEVEEIEVPKKESGDIQVTFNEVLK